MVLTSARVSGLGVRGSDPKMLYPYIQTPTEPYCPSISIPAFFADTRAIFGDLSLI